VMFAGAQAAVSASGAIADRSKFLEKDAVAWFPAHRVLRDRTLFIRPGFSADIEGIMDAISRRQ